MNDKKKEEKKKRHRGKFDVIKVKLARNTPLTPFNEAVSWQHIEMASANQAGIQPGYYHLNQYMHRENTMVPQTIPYYQNPVWSPPWTPAFPINPQPDPSNMFPRFQAPVIPQSGPFGAFQQQQQQGQIPMPMPTTGNPMVPMYQDQNQYCSPIGRNDGQNQMTPPDASMFQVNPNQNIRNMQPDANQIQMVPNYQNRPATEPTFHQAPSQKSPFSGNVMNNQARVNCLTKPNRPGSQLGSSPRSVVLENKINNVEQGLKKLESMIRMVNKQQSTQMFPDPMQKTPRLNSEITTVRFNQLVQQFNKLCQAIKIQEESQVNLFNPNRDKSEAEIKPGWLDKQTAQLDRLVNEVNQLEQDLNTQILSAIALQ